MIKATDKQLEKLNERYNDVKEDISLGIDYMGEGAEATSFEVDDNGRTTMVVEVSYLNNQFAIRSRQHVRHPRLTADEINYLLGVTNDAEAIS